MKLTQHLVYILVACTFLFCGCDFMKNREIKSAAKDLILEDIGKQLDKEQDSLIRGQNTRGKDFCKFVQNHAQIEILSIKEVSEGDYLVESKVRTVSAPVRQMVVEMLAKMDSRTANAFNFANALGLIHQQKPDLEIEIEQNISIEIQNKNNKWVRLAPL